MVEMSSQDVESMQEKMKNMSPEQLKEFQKQQCIFCHIVSGKVASKKIYEDEKCIALLDINPANPGHVLILPKEHYPIMPLMPEDIIKHLAMTAKAISQALLKALKAEGTTVFIANGTAAGQRAQHFMIHAIPRKEGDGIGIEIPEAKISDKMFEELRLKIKSKANEMFGIKEEKAEKKPEARSQKPEISGQEAEEKKEEKKEKKEKKKKVKKEKKEEVSLDDIADLLK